MGLRRLKRQIKRETERKDRPNHVQPADVIPSTDEVSAHSPYSTYFSALEQEAADRLSTRPDAVLLAIGPGAPANTLVSVIRRALKTRQENGIQEPLTVHVVERHPIAFQAVKASLSGLAVAAHVHFGSFPNTVPPERADVVLMHHVAQYMNPQEQKQAAELIAERLSQKGRVYYTATRPHTREMNLMANPLLRGRVTMESETFHRAMGKKLRIIAQIGPKNAKSRYITAEKD